MKLISHRGNINGKIEKNENSPQYIDLAIKEGYDVEVDVWVLTEHQDIIFLGHDEPQYKVNDTFFEERISKLWIHCKNINALKYFKKHKKLNQSHYFWHQEDDVTLTSFNIFWTYPQKQLTDNSICVLPELNDVEVPKFVYGICSDYVERYKKIGN